MSPGNEVNEMAGKVSAKNAIVENAIEIELACSGCDYCFPCPEEWQDSERDCYCQQWERVKRRKECTAWRPVSDKPLRVCWPDWCYLLERRRIPDSVAVKGLETLRKWFPEKRLYSLGHAYKDKEIPSEIINIALGSSEQEENIMPASLRDTLRGRAFIHAHEFCAREYGKTIAETYRQDKKAGRAAINWGISVAFGDSERRQKCREAADRELKDIYESMGR